jgi:prepilin-type N-terminal cleavage/methylation domain-containing protein
VGTRAPSGFSLLEVILALAILVGAIAVIGELIATGTRAAGAARDLTQAQLLCESKLNEITAGILIPDPVQGAPIETDMEWLYSIDLFPSDQNGIVAVKVTVYQDLPVERRPVTFSLVRWLQDPGIELPEPEDTSSAGGSSTSGTGSSASQGGSQSTGAAGAGT